MRLFAEEKKLRTEQLLLTSPVSITGMVVGKFLAAFTLFAIGIVLSLVNFIPLCVYAHFDGVNDAWDFCFSARRLLPLECLFPLSPRTSLRRQS